MAFACLSKFRTRLFKRHLRWLTPAAAALALTFSCLLPGGAWAQTITLGPALQYSGFFFGDVSQVPNVQGRLAAGGNLSLSGFSIGTNLAGAVSQPSLVVGGNIIALNGGSISVGKVVGFGVYSGAVAAGVPSYFDLRKTSPGPIDFASTRATLGNLSQQLARIAPTGTVSQSYSTVILSGTNQDVEFFNLNPEQVKSGLKFELRNVKATAYLILNVGSDPQKTTQIGITSSVFAPRASKVLFNLPETKSLHFTKVEVNGSVLAPFAAVRNSSGILKGTIVAVSWSSEMAMGNVPFIAVSHDVSAPLVSKILPGNAAVVAGTASIGASYADPGGTGVDVSRVRLIVDGADVSTKAAITAAGITYIPATPFAEGRHNVALSVPDLGGNVAAAEWSFSVDATSPVISNVSPNTVNLSAGANPVISASYVDASSGIDLETIRMEIDGVPVSRNLTITPAAVSYELPNPLSDGTHYVKLSVSDKVGNTAVNTWQFGVATALQIVITGPKDVLLPAESRPIISASFIQGANELDLASVHMIVNGTEVTAQATVSSTGISYVPPSGLASGPYNVYLSVANKINAAIAVTWNFDVDVKKHYEAAIVTPLAGTTVLTPQVVVHASAFSATSQLSGMAMNGKPMVLDGPGAEGRETGSVALDLVDGNNDLRLEVTFSDGEKRQAIRQVTYDAPSNLIIDMPADRATLGPVVGTSPRDLTGNVERPVTISGRTGKPVVSVTVNQQAATLRNEGKEFVFEKFFLHEGTNMISVVATDLHGRISSSSISVSVDQTAPYIAVETPRNNSVTSSDSVDVGGVANDAVEGYYGAGEPEVNVASNMGSIAAMVGSKQFIARGVPLRLGTNNITVTAKDQVGNIRTTQLNVVRIAAGSERLTAYAGLGQTGIVGTALENPLTVAAMNARGEPLVNLPVTFDVTRGTGKISTVKPEATATSTRNLVVKTDVNGLATVWISLGMQSGPASNVVRASVPNIAEEVFFSASGQNGPPKYIRADLGVNQYVGTGAQPLEPLTAVLLDGQENRIANDYVTFKVVLGDAKFDNGTDTVTVLTDKNGYAAVRPIAGVKAGVVSIKAFPPENGDALVEADFTLQVLEAKQGPTVFRGSVWNDKGLPLPGARVSIGRTSLSTSVDDKGLFTFDDVPAGRIDLFVDGRTVNLQGQQYPSLHFEAVAVKGAQNQLPHPIYLPKLQMSEAKIVGGNQDVVLKMPGIEGYEITVFANSVTFPDGSKTGPLVVSPLSLDKLPMTPPGGYAGFMAPAATIQPAGTRFDPPLQLKLPNTANFKAGEKKPVYQWDHDLSTFVQMGQATVSEDAAFLTTDAGTGISKAGWFPIPNPPPPDQCPSNPALKCPTCGSEMTSIGRCPRSWCKADTYKDGMILPPVIAYQFEWSGELLSNLTKKLSSAAAASGIPAKIKIQTKAKGTLKVIDNCCSLVASPWQSKTKAVAGAWEYEVEAAFAPPWQIRLNELGTKLEIAELDLLTLKFKSMIGFSGAGEYVDCSKSNNVLITGGGSLTGELVAINLKIPAEKPEWELQGVTGITGGYFGKLTAVNFSRMESKAEWNSFAYIKVDMKSLSMKYTVLNFTYPISGNSHTTFDF